MIIYFVRHGESEGNKKRLHQGPEVPLSEEGIKQGQVLAERLKKHKIDSIYLSPMIRAKQTAGIISDQLKIPVEFWENLKEIGNPSEIWGKPAEDKGILEIKKLARKKFLKGGGRYSDEETFEELNKRAKGVLEHLLLHHREQNVLCVSHATMIKMIICKAIFGESLTPEIFLQLREHLWLKNTGITVCEYTDKWGWTLVNWNDTSHI